MEFALLKKASENKFIQQLAGWQNCRKSCFGAEGWSGWFPEAAVQGIVSPRLFRVECFSRYTEVMQSSVVWTVAHRCYRYWVVRRKQTHLEASPGSSLFLTWRGHSTDNKPNWGCAQYLHGVPWSLDQKRPLQPGYRTRPVLASMHLLRTQDKLSQTVHVRDHGERHLIGFAGEELWHGFFPLIHEWLHQTWLAQHRVTRASPCCALECSWPAAAQGCRHTRAGSAHCLLGRAASLGLSATAGCWVCPSPWLHPVRAAGAWALWAVLTLTEPPLHFCTQGVANPQPAWILSGEQTAFLGFKKKMALQSEACAARV